MCYFSTRLNSNFFFFYSFFYFACDPVCDICKGFLNAAAPALYINQITGGRESLQGVIDGNSLHVAHVENRSSLKIKFRFVTALDLIKFLKEIKQQ